MSIYYIKQRIVTIKDKYIIYDINKEPILEITGSSFTGIFDRFLGNVFSIGHALYINSLKGKTEFILKKKVGFIWSKYDMVDNNNIIASMRRGKSLLVPKMNVNSEFGDYLITGDVLGEKFSIVKNKIEVAEVSKKRLSFGDSYKICVYENDTDKLIIAMVLAIDNCYHN